MITIKLTEKDAEILLEELHSLHGYHWNDDHIHADNCGSKVVYKIEEQVEVAINSKKPVGV